VVAPLPVRWGFDWTPTSLRRVSVLGGLFGLGYPLGGIIALDVGRRVYLATESTLIAGGVPAVVAALGVSALLWIGIYASAQMNVDAVHSLGVAVFTVTYASVLPTEVAVLLPILFPAVVPRAPRDCTRRVPFDG